MRVEEEKCRLPVDVRGSKTAVLELSSVHGSSVLTVRLSTRFIKQFLGFLHRSYRTATRIK